MKRYVCIGKISGNCGHRHIKLHRAAECVKRDRIGCQNQGGYSDRYVFEHCLGPEGFDYVGLDRDDWEHLYAQDGLLS